MTHIRPSTATDFYKTGHRRQYPQGTSFVYSNFTCRSDKLARVLPDFDHKVVFFGLQGALQYLVNLWDVEFFGRDKDTVVSQYKRRMDKALGPDAVPVDHIAALWDLGFLPILVKALPEGSRVNMRVSLWTICNILPRFFWLVNYLETQLSAECWKPIHTATIAYEYRRLLLRYAELTGSPVPFVDWQGHDFSARGMSGIHDAAVNGAGHLLSFLGTDTIGAIDYLEYYYGAEDTFVGGSVPATEHSVMCMGGTDGELDMFRRLITEEYPSGIVSIVSDTWDFWKVMTEYALALKDEILARKEDALGFAKVVFRPDSGDPVKIICGDPDAEQNSPAYLGAVRCLWNIFGGTVTSTGHKLLDSHVGVIYGDSITLERATAILSRLREMGFASANIVFGIGSFTYQMATRDSFGCAIKATFGVVNGEDRVLFKDPVTDSGTKTSARGLIRVEKEGGDFVQYDNQNRSQEKSGELRIVFLNGRFMNQQALKTIRARLKG